MEKLEEGNILQKRYKILNIIGSGGLSTVYLAQDLVVPKKWAVKEFSPDHLNEEEKKKISEQFEKEATILSSLNHPRLPKIVDYFTENNKKYIVMEFLNGETLEDIMKREGKGLKEEEVRKWALSLCEALDYLHSQEPAIIHRDIKPQNLIITSDGEIKFIDFGIARIFNPVKKHDTLFMGTPGFASPEQFGSRQTDPRSDIYSLGATLHYLLSNHNPAASPFKFAPVTSYNSEVTKEMEEIIIKALEIEPSHRFSSIKEIILVLSGKVSVKELPSTPWPLIDPTEILLSDLPYKKNETSLKIKNAGGGTLKGHIKSDSNWLKPEKEEFIGNEEEIKIIIEPKELEREKKHSGNIDIITNFTRKSIPVEISFLPPFLKRLPSWAVCLLLWIIPSLIAWGWSFFYNVTNILTVNSYYHRILSPTTPYIPSLILLIILGFSVSYRRFYFLISGAWFALLFLMSESTSTFILIVTFNIFILSKIYQKLSQRQKEDMRIPLAISLLLPAIIVIILKIFFSQSGFSLGELAEMVLNRIVFGTSRSGLYFKKDIFGMVIILLGTSILILINYGNIIVNYIFSRWNIKVPLYIKNTIQYIAVFSAGLTWAIEGIVYNKMGLDFRELYAPRWAIMTFINHWTLYLPAKISSVNTELSILLTVTITIICWYYLNQVKYGKSIIYLFITFIALNIFSLSLNHNSIEEIKYLVKYPASELCDGKMEHLMGNANISLDVKAVITNYSKIKHYDYDYFFSDSSFKGNYKNLIIYLFLKDRYRYSENNEKMLNDFEKYYKNTDISYNRLKDFIVEDRLFHLPCKIYDEKTELKSDGEVIASFYYYRGLSKVCSLTNPISFTPNIVPLYYIDMINYMKKSLNMYEKINKDIFKDRIKEIKHRLSLCDKYDIENITDGKYEIEKLYGFHIEMAKYLKNNGKKDFALKELNAIYNISGDNSNILKQIGDMAYEMREEEDAVSSNKRPYYVYMNNTINKASMYYYKALNAGYNKDDINADLGKVEFNRYWYDGALKNFDLIKRNRTGEEELFIARCYYEEKTDKNKALNYYMSSMKKLGSSFPCDRFYDIAVLLDEMGRKKEALEYYKKALKTAHEPLKDIIESKLSKKEEKEIIEIREFKKTSVEVTVLLTNRPTDELEYYKMDDNLYDLKYSNNISAEVVEILKDGEPVEKIKIKWLKSSGSNGFINFKKKDFAGLSKYTDNSFTYRTALYPKIEIDKMIYIIAMPGDLTVGSNTRGNYVADKSDTNRILHIIERMLNNKETSSPSGDIMLKISDGWNIVTFDRSGCSNPINIRCDGYWLNTKEDNFIQSQWKSTGVNEKSELSSINYNPVLSFTSQVNIPKILLILLIPNIIPVIWLYKRFIKDKKDTVLRIEKIREKFGYFPMEMAEEFFERSGINIKEKKITDKGCDDLIAEGKKKFLKKYNAFPVRCFNKEKIESNEINNDLVEKLEEFYGKDLTEKLAIIVTPGKLSLENKFDISKLKMERGVILPVLTLDDIKTGLFEEYSGKEYDGSGIKNLIRNRITIAEQEENLYYYTQKVTDPVMFYGRQEIAEKVISFISRGMNGGIFGLRKIGKSSFNMYLQRELRKKDNYYPSVISLQRSTPTGAGIFEDIIHGLKTEIKGKNPSINLPPLEYDRKKDGEGEELARCFKEDILKLKKILPEESKIVIFIDEIDLIYPEENNRKNHIHFHTVFTTLRGLSEIDGNIVVIVQGFSSKINSVNNFPEEFAIPENPVFQFFKEINLSNLTKEDSYSLVEEIGAMMGISYERESLDAIYYEGGGHPYLTRLLCSGIFTVIEENKKSSKNILTVTPNTVEKAINYCLENYSDYLSYLDLVLKDDKEVINNIISGKEEKGKTEKLKKLGIVKTDNDKTVISYNLYRRWLNKN